MAVNHETGEAPALQVMPDLEADVAAALRDSIKSFGVLQPIVVSQDGQILDGHNRWRIAGELGVSCPQIVREVKDEAEALEIATTLNLNRRHLDRPSRLRLAESLREKGHSLRAIAGALGVSHEAVRKDLGSSDPDGVNGLTPSGSPHHVTGTDGVQQPAKKRRWTTEELATLLEKRNAGATLVELANEYGISDRNISAKLAEAKLGQAKNSKRSPNAVQKREAAVRQMADDGYTTRQIMKALGLSREGVRGIAARIGVEITADAVVGTTRNHDSERIVTETVIALEGSVMALGLVDFDELDPAQCAEWATSISNSLRALTRFHKQLKEMTRDEG